MCVYEHTCACGGYKKALCLLAMFQAMSPLTGTLGTELRSSAREPSALNH